MQEKEEVPFVKWFSELNKDSIPIAGGKGANLSEIYNLKVPVPPGFVITAQAYDYFIRNANLKERIEKLLSRIDYENTKELDETTKEIRELIVSASFSSEMESEVLDSYNSLSTDEKLQEASAYNLVRGGTEPVFVAVRSSATTEDLAEASFAGQQESFLNVKGNANLIENIKKCFASLFTSRATYYRNKQGFKHTKASLAVVVQRMVDSDKSGVIFSKDPSYKNDNIIIEAVWGLGEGIVSGMITPDTYRVSQDLKIIDKKISEKKIAITRDSGGNTKTVQLREEKSRYQVLKEYEITKLAEMALKLEDHYKKPQDIEFAIENDAVYIVQTRPITTLGKRSDEGKDIHGEVILTGLAASPGIAYGKVKIVMEMKDLEKITKGDILVTKMTNPDMVVSMQKSAAIVTDEGGLTAHAAIVSREMGIPAVVGTQDATKKLKDGDIITVDAFKGKVYKGKVSETVSQEVLPIEAKTKIKIKVIVDLPSAAERASKSGIREVGLTRLEGIIAESGKHPRYFLTKGNIKDYEEVIFKGVKGIAEHFDKLWVRTSDIRSDEFQNLEGALKEVEANPMLGMHGIRYSLKNLEILKTELNALKRVSDLGKEIGVLLPQVIMPEEVAKVKKLLIEIGFNRAKVGVMVETPAAVQRIKDLCEEGIDFVSFGTNDLTQYILAVDRGNKDVQYLYNEMNPAVLYQIEFVIRVCKRHGVQTSICGQAGSNKEMVKFLIEKGIDSISVNADKAKEISEYVAQLEKSLVVGTDKEPRKYEQKTQEENFKKDLHKKDYGKNISEKEKVRIEKDIEEIEKEKREYLEAHPEEEKSAQEEYETTPEQFAEQEDKVEKDSTQNEKYETKPEFASKDEIESDVEKDFESIFQ
ncbi:phosphoenolpyruvate synthase [Candidatus Pacearchaeota archaeon]|nr:phosphoenolpyruvate synthase [Candidatus Pacearchaeota archaeon]